MLFRVLGCLEVCHSGSWLRINAVKCRSLLAAMIARSPHIVSVDALVLELWGDHPPKTAVTQIHGYVMRLRRLLGNDRRGALETVGPGYRLLLDAGDVDAAMFGHHVERGHEAWRGDQPERAAEQYRRALLLWRGPAFVDVPRTDLLAAEVDRLAEQRILVWESWVDAEFTCGRYAELLSELRSHVAEHPLRERAWGQLMLALYRCGQLAQALQTFQLLRRTLIDALGVEPGHELQRLHQQLLSGKLSFRGESPSAWPDPPRQLPPDIPDLVGREAQAVAAAAQLLVREGNRPPSVLVISGCPGVGKTALAVHVAHRVAVRFPDGQLYLDLGGTSSFAPPAVLLAELLRSLGIVDDEIPSSENARAALFRSVLTSRRALLLLDDAAHAGQVRPLLPPSATCSVLVTSRWGLGDLAGARHVDLRPLPEPDALAMLAAIVGATRMRKELEQATAVVRTCAGLPLAIRIVGGKLVNRPAWSVRLLRERLDDRRRRLVELRLGTLSAPGSFQASVDRLTAVGGHAFRLLGLLDPEPFPGWVLGPLLSRPDSDDVIDELLDAHLLEHSEIDANSHPTYRLPDLLHCHAAEQTHDIPAADRRAAVGRILTAWLDLLRQAAERLSVVPSPAPDNRSPANQLPATVANMLLATPAAWLAAERAAVTRTIHLAEEWRLDVLKYQLTTIAATLYRSHPAHGPHSP